MFSSYPSDSCQCDPQPHDIWKSIFSHTVSFAIGTTVCIFQGVAPNVSSFVGVFGTGFSPVYNLERGFGITLDTGAASNLCGTNFMRDFETLCLMPRDLLLEVWRDWCSFSGISGKRDTDDKVAASGYLSRELPFGTRHMLSVVVTCLPSTAAVRCGDGSGL